MHSGLNFGGDRALGPRKIRLLEWIRETGSISAAARALKMSYTRAWHLVDGLNGMFRMSVVARQTCSPAWERCGIDRNRSLGHPPLSRLRAAGGRRLGNPSSRACSPPRSSIEGPIAVEERADRAMLFRPCPAKRTSMRSNVGFDTDALCPSAASEYMSFAGAGGLGSSEPEIAGRCLQMSTISTPRMAKFCRAVERWMPIAAAGEELLRSFW